MGNKIKLEKKVNMYVVVNRRNSFINSLPFADDLKVTYL